MCQLKLAGNGCWSCFEKDSVAMFRLNGKRCCDGLAMSALDTEVGECWCVCQIFGMARLDNCGNLFQLNVLIFK